MNVVDYIRENNSSLFKFSSVSAVESLVLSQLSYYRFENFEKGNTIGQILNKVDISDFSKTSWNKDESKHFLEAIYEDPFWSKIKFVDYMSLFDEQKEEQFCSVVFELKKGLYYIAFRGTDGTFTGWKEDFNMSFMTSVPSQHSAISFTKSMLAKYDGYFFLGGHSKGGNLAHYAMLFVDDSSARKIRRSDSFDGPGIQLAGIDIKIEDRKAKLLKFIPENSVVGRIYEYDQDYLVTIKSKSKHIFDHDLFTWEVKDQKFVLAKDQSRLSDYVKATIDTFNSKLDNDIKMDFIDFVYDVSKKLDTNSVSKANENFIENFKLFLKAYRNASPGKKEDWKLIAKTLGKASLKSGDLLLPQILDKGKNESQDKKDTSM
ncbi:MAG: DUF2974 domain-containing protein [Tissierellia bacterium]|nr:DUF2974 domain-containing protein [Tissierellia bacterium]